MFRGLDDTEKVKGATPMIGVITDVWVEEATESNEHALKQLHKRLRGKADVAKRIMLSFNPILKSNFIYKKYFRNIGWTDDQTYFSNDNLSILKTTYKDNRFLELDDIADLVING